MEIKIKINPEENEKIALLYGRFTSYCEILGYLSKYGSIDTDLFDRKWEEAVRINQELMQMKNELDKKYHPDGMWTNYNFDFISSEMIYYNV